MDCSWLINRWQEDVDQILEGADVNPYTNHTLLSLAYTDRANDPRKGTRSSWCADRHVTIRCDSNIRIVIGKYSRSSNITCVVKIYHTIPPPMIIAATRARRRIRSNIHLIETARRKDVTSVHT